MSEGSNSSIVTQSSTLPQRLTGLGLIVLAAGSLMYLTTIDAPALEGDPGPILFPALASGGLGLCGLLILVLPSRSENSGKPQERYWRVSGLFLLALVLYVLLMQFVGYWISTPLFLAASMLILTRPGQKKLLPMAILAVVVTVVVGYTFSSALNVVLP